MRPLLALALLTVAPATALAQEPAMPLTYENLKYCTAMYELYAYDAEAQGDDAAYRARLEASNTAYAKAGALGVKAGKSADDVKREVEATTQGFMDRPPQLAVARSAVRRCDAALGLSTP